MIGVCEHTTPRARIQGVSATRTRKTRRSRLGNMFGGCCCYRKPNQEGKEGNDREAHDCWTEVSVLQSQVPRSAHFSVGQRNAHAHFGCGRCFPSMQSICRCTVRNLYKEKTVFICRDQEKSCFRASRDTMGMAEKGRGRLRCLE